MQVKAWVIQNKINPKMFWSNENGWVEACEDCFSDWHKRTFNLPTEGMWVEVLVLNGG